MAIIAMKTMQMEGLIQDTEVVWIDTATAEEAEPTVSTEKLRLRRLRSTACPVEIIKRDNTTTTSLRPESSRGIQVLASIWHSIEIKEDRPLNCIKSPMNRDPLHTATSCTWNTPQGEAFLSPMVQCGPKGLRFLQPVELRIPHVGSQDPQEEWNVSLKTSNEKGQWRQVELTPNGDHPVGVFEQTDKKCRNFLSVFVDHF